MATVKKLFKFTFFSTIVSLILGVLLHFTFEWSNNNQIIASFSSINESVWEHLKLVFYPMLITTIIGCIIFKDNFTNFLCARTIGILSAISFIIVFFYTYTGIIGTNFSILDIGSFIISILLGEYVSFKKTLLSTKCNKWLCVFILTLLLFCFVLFTYFPPKINLFKDPLSNSYGLQKG